MAMRGIAGRAVGWIGCSELGFHRDKRFAFTPVRSRLGVPIYGRIPYGTRFVLPSSPTWHSHLGNPGLMRSICGRILVQSASRVSALELSGFP